MGFSGKEGLNVGATVDKPSLKDPTNGMYNPSYGDPHQPPTPPVAISERRGRANINKEVFSKTGKTQVT